uniref:Rab5-bind domain-containing protein n=1 Tax=Glossina austeni TaxID=7395 RepID=A0A1A9UT65_GLOAU
MQQKFLEAKDDIMRQSHRVSDDREKVNKHLQVLQADNDLLSGRYLATAEEIENQYINLLNTVEELQELILKQQQELIKSRLGFIMSFRIKYAKGDVDEDFGRESALILHQKGIKLLSDINSFDSQKNWRIGDECMDKTII